jgi:uncharacterized OsmC-like protein
MLLALRSMLQTLRSSLSALRFPSPRHYLSASGVTIHIPTTTSLVRHMLPSNQIRSLQAPIKERYRESPAAAIVTLTASGRVGEGVSCSVQTGKALVEAGLHPATGGSGLQACSGDMLLEALVACAGVTLNAVASALDIPLRDATIRAEGDLDFRGTLGVVKDAPVGFTAIRLFFQIDSDASAEQLDKLIALTERYCVIFQTLAKPPQLSMSYKA